MTTLSGLLMYLKAMETQGRGRFLWLAGLAAVTLVGVFSKESAVAVLGIVVLYEFTWRDRRRVQGLLQGCLAMLPAFLALWWMRSRVMAQSAPASFPFVDNPITGADFLTGRLTALKVLAKYVGLLVWPAHLSADYSYRQIPLATGTPSDWIAWILMGAIVFGVTLLYRRNKAAFFAAGLALITVLPASNLVVPVGAIMAERFLYLPAAGFAICLVPAIYAAARRLGLSSRFPLAAGLLIVSGFGARTWARNRDWRDELTFWSIAVQTSPLSFKTHTILAETLHAEHRDPDQAIREDERKSCSAQFSA